MLVYAYARGGATVAGLVALAQLVPAALFAPVASAIADRRSPVVLLAGGYLAQAAGMAATAGAILAGVPLAAYAAAMVAATAVTTTRPAQSTLIPSLCASPDQLTAANVVVGWVEATAITAARPADRAADLGRRRRDRLRHVCRHRPALLRPGRAPAGWGARPVRAAVCRAHRTARDDARRRGASWAAADPGPADRRGGRRGRPRPAVRHPRRDRTRATAGLGRLPQCRCRRRGRAGGDGQRCAGWSASRAAGPRSRAGAQRGAGGPRLRRRGRRNHRAAHPDRRQPHAAGGGQPQPAAAFCARAADRQDLRSARGPDHGRPGRRSAARSRSGQPRRKPGSP